MGLSPEVFGLLYGVLGVAGDLFYLPQLWLLWHSREARRATSLVAWSGWAAIDIVQLLYALSIEQMPLTIVSVVNIILQVSVVALAAAQRIKDVALPEPLPPVPVEPTPPLLGLAEAAAPFRPPATTVAGPGLPSPERCAEIMRNLALCRDLYVSEAGGKGAGIFAARRFRAGETIVHEDSASYGARTVSRAELAAHGHELDWYTFQVGPDAYLLPRGAIDDLTNHSCEPSAGIRLDQGGYRLIALRDIAPGEEITYDYSTYLAGYHEAMRCCCGSRLCRGLIGAFADLPAERRRYYIEAGVVPAFVLDELAAEPDWDPAPAAAQ
jgi:hypothetical protein